MKRRLISAFIFAVATCSAARLEHKKIAPDFGDPDPFTNVRVIIQWKNEPSTEHHKVLNRGGFLHASHQSIKAGTYSIPAWQLTELANDPDVKYISPDRPVKARLDYTAAAINASSMWNAGWDGTGDRCGRDR